MIIFKLAQPLTLYLQKQAKKNKKIGFVPTMGALHQGHLSLVRASKLENDITVCSIFVNPTQFNNAADLKHYPVTIEADIELLAAERCDILFLPDENEIYPPGFQAKHYELGPIENRLEGFYRPGHFQGVCQVVDQLLQAVNPTNLYMGQKDYQQCMVIKKLLALTQRSATVALHIVATVREKSGLAMSSRNLRLSESEKQTAAAIYLELMAIKSNIQQNNFSELIRSAESHLASNGFKVDYVEIADATDLNTATSNNGLIVALVAASIGPVRLIDNLMLN